MPKKRSVNLAMLFQWKTQKLEKMDNGDVENVQGGRQKRDIEMLRRKEKKRCI